jgi:hypothetical protein
MMEGEGAAARGLQTQANLLHDAQMSSSSLDSEDAAVLLRSFIARACMGSQRAEDQPLHTDGPQAWFGEPSHCSAEPNVSTQGLPS